MLIAEVDNILTFLPSILKTKTNTAGNALEGDDDGEVEGELEGELEGSDVGLEPQSLQDYL